MRPACTILMLSVLLVAIPTALAQEYIEALPKVVQNLNCANARKKSPEWPPACFTEPPGTKCA